jgi:hypothetical protein
MQGDPDKRKALEMRFFYMAEAPDFLKHLEPEIPGEYFSVKYGVISRHFGKNEEHNLTANNWIELCSEIVRPFAISKYKDGFRFFTNAKSNKKYIVVGIDVKNPAEGLKINAVTTAFSYRPHGNEKEDFFYVSPKITPEQIALLNQLNSGQYLSVQKGGTDDLNTLSPYSPEKSSGRVANSEP